MRLTTVILIACLMQVSAAGLAQKISLSEKNAPITKIFDQIRLQCGYDFLVRGETLKSARPVTIEVRNLELKEVLKKIAEDQPLEFKIEERMVVVSKKESQLNSGVGLIDVQGQVLDDDGNPLEGITVLVKNKDITLATKTDWQGRFFFKDIPANSILVFSGLKIDSYEMKLDGKNNLTIRLKTKIFRLENVEIVSTGYQLISKERSTGAFSKPNDEILKSRSTSMNILQRLDGLIPGLTINNAPNSEDGKKNNILIRGVNSINANRAPLYVVDGISMEDISSINPQDVSDVTVLKDATAASIWGSRASNGVIVVTTKKGKANEGLKIEYDAFLNIQGKPDINYFPVLNSRQFIQAAREVFDPVANPWPTISGYFGSSSVGVPPHEVILYNQYRGLINGTQANKSLDSLSGISNTKQIKDLWYRNAALMNHTLSLSAGTNTYSFYGSLAYTNTQSNRPGDSNHSYKVNLRQDFNFNKRFQAFLITDLTNTLTEAKRPINIDNRFLPYQLFQDGGGRNLSIPYVQYLSEETRAAYEKLSGINLNYNPLDELNYGYTKSDALLARITAGFTFKLLNGLKLEGTYGLLKGNNTTKAYDNQNSYLVRSEVVQFTEAASTPNGSPVYNLPATGGKYTVNNAIQRDWTVRHQLVYNKDWDDKKHQLSLLAGQEAQDRLISTVSSTIRGYDDQLLTSVPYNYGSLSANGVRNPIMPKNNGISILQNDNFRSTETQVRFVSYYGNMAYTYDGKYTLNGSWRIDQSNLFGKDKSAQNKPVWSVGGKWLLSNESFLDGNTLINSLALRTTYGITGNSPAPGTAASFDILKPDNSLFFPNGGLIIETPANKKLVWESTKTLNMGLDFTLLKNRLTGSIDVYRKKTSNLIGILPTNAFTGYNTVTGNFGDLKNNGIEFTLSSVNLETKNFSWNTIFNLSHNKNEITKLNLASPITTGDQKVNSSYVVGYPALSAFAYDYAGLDNLGDPLVRLHDGTITKMPFVTKPEDIRYMGTFQPVWSGGMTNMFRYKKWSLDFNIIYNLGHVMRRDVSNFYGGRLLAPSVNTFNDANINAEFADRWKVPGDELKTDIPSYVSNNAISMSRRQVEYYTYGSSNVLDASYIKMRDVTLSYDLPKNIINSIGLKAVKLRFQVSNLMLWKANSYGIDPEFQDSANSSISRRTMRTDQGTITIGAHVSL